MATPSVEGPPSAITPFEPVITEMFEGPPVTVTILARSPPKPGIAEAAMVREKRKAVSGNHKTGYLVSPGAKDHEHAPSSESEAPGRRRRRSRAERHLGEHIRSVARQ